MDGMLFYALSSCLITLICIFLLAGLYKLFIQIKGQRQYLRLRKRRLKLELETARLKYKYVQSEEAYSWNGYRKFLVEKKVPEANGVFSFYLIPHDERPFPMAKPGQYLTFKLDIPSEDKDVIRCYSLSDSTLDKPYYRVSIKKVPPPRDQADLPSGLSSSYFHDTVNPGDLLDVKIPSGHFFLDSEKVDSVVLIAGGIGLTPVLSMLNYLCDTQTDKEIWLYYGVICGNDFMMKDHFDSISDRFPNVKIVRVFSNPIDSDQQGVDYDHEGHVSVELFKKLLPSNNYDFFICGPPPMMNALTADLEAWGVPERYIHYETFGPASVKQVEKGLHAGDEKTEAKTVKVTFKKHNKTVEWSTGTSLLDLAEEHNIALDFGCKAGSCGTCSIALHSGDVDYPITPDFDIERGSCLACIAQPKDDIVVDA